MSPRNDPSPMIRLPGKPGEEIARVPGDYPDALPGICLSVIRYTPL